MVIIGAVAIELEEVPAELLSKFEIDEPGSIFTCTFWSVFEMDNFESPRAESWAADASNFKSVWTNQSVQEIIEIIVVATVKVHQRFKNCRNWRTELTEIFRGCNHCWCTSESILSAQFELELTCNCYQFIGASTLSNWIINRSDFCWNFKVDSGIPRISTNRALAIFLRLDCVTETDYACWYCWTQTRMTCTSPKLRQPRTGWQKLP